jgi:NADH-quinone oxidoreductase subunit E
MSEFQFTEINLKKYKEVATHYDDVESGLLPALHLAQEQNSYLSDEVVNYISELMNIPKIKIKEVISFYDMFYGHPVGQNTVQVCTNITCSLFGGRDIFKSLLKYYETENLTPSEDGKVMIQKMECLGSCEQAPCMRINNNFHGHITIGGALEKLEKL